MTEIYKNDLNVGEFLKEMESFKFYILEIDQHFKTVPTTDILRYLQIQAIRPWLPGLYSICILCIISGYTFINLKGVTWLHVTLKSQVQFQNIIIVEISGFEYTWRSLYFHKKK